MIKRLVFLAALAAFSLSAIPSFAAEDPRKALLEKFEMREKNLIAALIVDPGEARAFYNDALAVQADPKKLEEVMIIWRGKGVQYARKYLNREKKTNLAGKRLRDMVEPSEWGFLMEMLRNMEGGWTKDTLIGWIQDSDKGLAKGDNSKALDTIKTAREKLTDDFEEYTETDEAAAALTAYAKLVRKRAEEEKLREAARKRKDGEDAALAKANREKALDQAEQAAERAKLAKKNPSEEGAKTGSGDVFTGEKEKKGTVYVPIGDTPVEDDRVAKKPNLVLDPSKTGPGKSTLGEEPPPPLYADEESDLEEMKSGTGGIKTLKAAMYGAGIGGIIGLLLGLFTPVGLIVGVLVGAVIGGAGTYLAAKKIFA